EPDWDHDGKEESEPPNGPVPASPVDAEGLERAPRAVVQVHGQGHHGQQVNDGDGPAVEAVHDVAIDVTALEVREGTPRQIHQVEHDEEAEEDAAPPHRAGRVAGLHHVVLAVGVLAAGFAASCQLHRVGDVHDHGE